MDKFTEKKIEKIFEIMNNSEPDTWKRNDLFKVIDATYMKGFNDGELSEKAEAKARTHRIIKNDGRRFIIKRGSLDFASYTKLCQKLGVRLDSDRIDFVGFDMKVFREDGYEFADPRLEQENICQQAVTLST